MFIGRFTSKRLGILALSSGFEDIHMFSALDENVSKQVNSQIRMEKNFHV